jgi:non-specific serine/threonine protein kinase
MLTERMDLHPEKKSPHHFYHFKDDDGLRWLIQRGRKYLEKGFNIYSIKWKRFIGGTAGTLRLDISADIDWLEFTPLLADRETGQTLEPDLENMDPELTDSGVLIDKKGMLHLVTAKEIERLKLLYRYAQRSGNRFRVPSRNHILIRKLYDKKMADLPAIKKTLDLEKRLKDFEEIPGYQLTDSFNGTLRHYQQEGFKWLSFLRDYGFSGCLADDMGLGKTVQTLALLQTLKDRHKLNTSLLVVPVSAIPNWESEIARFSPALTVHRHMGPGRGKDSAAWSGMDLVITSYATMRNDIEILKDIEFDYIILDESQNIKNISSQVSGAVKVIRAKNRLALSGTPVENNSSELWSLFDFLMPGFLGSFGWFSKHMAQPIERENDGAKAELLKKMVYPFILRRKKGDVETELPEKTEIVSKLRMDEEQLKLYSQTARFYKDELESEIDKKGVTGSSMRILEGMLRLRQICLFPRLADKKHLDIPSAKFEHLKELLEDVLAEGHKVLIFSQFVQALQVIKEHCEEQAVQFSYLDGSTPLKTRQQMIENFQENKDTGVFLLSLKAGGIAINLTAADYVIIFDPWWNPAVEAQAIDRSHRIGQTKKVMVYRMVIENTIEEKMLELQEKMLELQDRKKALVDQLISTDSTTFKDLKKEDILNLFA